MGTREPEEQRRHRCTVINRCEWEPAEQIGTPYMGDPSRPYGESDVEGCPGGWYRTAFYRSFERYRSGQHESPYLRGCADRLVFDALQYFEGESGKHSESLT